MKTLLLYKTVHGSTKQYAEWIHEEISDSVIANLDVFDTKSLSAYNTVIIGSYVQGGKIPAIEFMQNNWNILKMKKVVLFAVGMIPVKSFMSKKSFEMIPEEIRKSIQYFKLPGQATYKKPNIFERFIFKFLFGANPDSKIDREFINPILDYINK